MKKVIALVLCVVMCIPLFMSCGSDEPKDTSTANTPTTTGPVSTGDETTKESVYKDIVKNDWGGHQFKIMYCDDHTNSVQKDFVCDEPNGDTLNDQVYKRNTMVETDYNISLYVEPYQGNAYQQVLQAQYDSGWSEFDYNMFGLAGRAAMGFSLKGYMADLGTYDEINLYRDYWEQSFIEQIMLDDSIYGIIGDISATAQTSQQVICFNKNLFRQEGYEEPYDLVRTYEWTVDKLLEYMEGFPRDYDNNGYDWTADRFAMSGWGTECAYGLFYASGFMYCKNDGETITLDFDRDELDDVIEKTLSVWSKAGTYFIDTGKVEDHNKPHDVFSEGRGLFCDIMLNKIQIFFTNMEDDYGIVPEPMHSVDQKVYYSYTGYGTPTMVVPATDPNPERTGNIIEALCTASSDVVIPKMYEIVTKIQHARDEDSAEMIEIALNSQVFDACQWLGLTGIESMIRSLIKAGGNYSASYIRIHYDTAEGVLKNYIDSYAKLKDK